MRYLWQYKKYYVRNHSVPSYKKKRCTEKRLKLAVSHLLPKDQTPSSPSGREEPTNGNYIQALDVNSNNKTTMVKVSAGKYAMFPTVMPVPLVWASWIVLFKLMKFLLPLSLNLCRTLHTGISPLESREWKLTLEFLLELFAMVRLNTQYIGLIQYNS